MSIGSLWIWITVIECVLSSSWWLSDLESRRGSLEEVPRQQAQTTFLTEIQGFLVQHEVSSWLKFVSLTCSQSSLLTNMQIDKYLIQVGHSKSLLSIENRLCLYWPLSSCKVWDKLDLLCNSKRRSRRCERTKYFVWYLNFKFVFTEKSFQIFRQTSALNVCTNVILSCVCLCLMVTLQILNVI